MYLMALIALLTLVSLTFGDTISVSEAGAGTTQHKVTVKVAGRFEGSFTRENGFAKDWFDLKNDPSKQRNLGPLYDGGGNYSGMFWVKFHKDSPYDGVSWEPNPVDTMKILEANTVRTRIRLKGPHTYYGVGDYPMTGILYEQIFTVYPNGNVYISYIVETFKDETYVGEAHFITRSTGKWGSNPGGINEVRALNETGPNRAGSTAWHMQTSNGPTYFADILLVAKKGKYTNDGAYWGSADSYLDRDFRTAFLMGHPWDTGDNIIHPGKHPLYFLMRLADDMNDVAAGNLYANDYRTPDALLVTEGQVDKTDPGDKDVDGFSEAEGCYVLNCGTAGVRFAIKGTASITRTYPAFKIKNWRWGVPASIAWGGQTLQVKQDYNAAVVNGSLVLQVFKSVGNTSADAAVLGTGTPTVWGQPRLISTTALGAMKFFDIQGRFIGTGRDVLQANQRIVRIGPKSGMNQTDAIIFGLKETSRKRD